MTEPSRGIDFDVAVVGGGIVGTAVAWGLARTGAKVAVLDEGDVAIRPSRGNFALVWLQGKGLGMPEYANWTRGAIEAWAEFARMLGDQTGIDLVYRQPGGFMPVLSSDELEERATAMKRLHNQPGLASYPYEVLDRDALAKELPFIGPDVVGATYCPLDGHCNSLRLLRALHQGLERSGVAYRPNHRVESIGTQGGEFRLQTAKGEIRAGKLVIAAGHDSARLAPMVGLEAPVRPQRGHVIVTEKTAPFLHYPTGYVRQTNEGGVMIGDSFEEAGFDTTLRPGVSSAVAERAIRFFPLLGRLNVVRSWAALRVLTPDGFPIYEESAAMPGAFVVTCHSGVTLAPSHALVLAPMIAAGNLSEALTVFSARRFRVQQAA